MWRKNFTKIVDGFFRRAQPLSSCDWTSLYPASLTRFSVGLYTESPINIEDGTWTLNLPQDSRHRDGLWIGWLEREAIVLPGVGLMGLRRSRDTESVFPRLSIQRFSFAQFATSRYASSLRYGDCPASCDASWLCVLRNAHAFHAACSCPIC